MRKVLLFTGLFILLGTTASFSQLQEVRGVETRWATFSHNGRLYFGVAFRNGNSFPVSIEAELWRTSRICTRDNRKQEVIIDTRSFNLDAGEEFIWRQTGRSAFRVYINNWRQDRPGANYYSRDYSVRFRAFRLE